MGIMVAHEFLLLEGSLRVCSGILTETVTDDSQVTGTGATKSWFQKHCGGLMFNDSCKKQFEIDLSSPTLRIHKRSREFTPQLDYDK